MKQMTWAGLQILAILVESKKKLSDLVNILKLHPQVKSNIKFNDNNPLLKDSVSSNIRNIINNNTDLKIVVRKSGTEKLIRVLVEGKEKAKIEKVHEEIVKTII